MGIGISVFFIAVGAVLAFAVHVPATGIDLDVVGLILMAVGFATLVYTLMWWSDVMPWRRSRTVIRERYVDPPRIGPAEHPHAHEHHVVEYEERAG
jgi:hypothetical protein